MVRHTFRAFKRMMNAGELGMSATQAAPVLAFYVERAYLFDTPRHKISIKIRGKRLQTGVLKVTEGGVGDNFRPFEYNHLTKGQALRQYAYILASPLLEYIKLGNQIVFGNADSVEDTRESSSVETNLPFALLAVSIPEDPHECKEYVNLLRSEIKRVRTYRCNPHDLEVRKIAQCTKSAEELEARLAARRDEARGVCHRLDEFHEFQGQAAKRRRR